MKNLSFVAGLVILLGLMICSLFIGAGHVTFANLWSDPDMRDIFFISRVPRTLALVLAGSAMSVSGLIMQMLTQNRFVEPSIAGTTQSASLGLLLVMVFSPSASVMIKMLVATLFAMGGTVLFMMLLARMRMKSALMVPLTGIMLGAVFSAVTTFLAMGDNLRRTIPWVGLCGGGLVVLCDIIGRLISYPFEIPASVILGVIGALVFLLLIVRTKRHAG